MLSATNSRAVSGVKATTRQATFKQAVRPTRSIQPKALGSERSQPSTLSSMLAAATAAALLVRFAGAAVSEHRLMHASIPICSKGGPAFSIEVASF